MDKREIKKFVEQYLQDTASFGVVPDKEEAKFWWENYVKNGTVDNFNRFFKILQKKTKTHRLYEDNFGEEY